MEQPKNHNHKEWAEFNQQMANITLQEMASRFPDLMRGFENMNKIEVVEEPFELQVFEVPGPINDLLTAVRQAVSELAEQGEKSNRIAMQLTEAMARFAAETEMP